MEWILEACSESLFVLPALFIANLIVEYFSGYLENKRDHHIGPTAGGILGLIPQCGFSGSISILYVNGAITYGTLLSSFIAVNDEALLVLLANPKYFKITMYLLISKVILGVTIGIIYDSFHKNTRVIKTHSIHQHSHEHKSILKESLNKTVRIFVFVLLVNVLFGFIMNHFESVIIGFMNEHTLLQIIFAALIGFIPNCSSVVILAQLYIDGIIQFAVLFSGLITYVGLGNVMLFKYGNSKTAYKTMVYLFVLAIILGYGITLIWNI